jgi:DNA-binding XRE family transcriptional regulator
VENKIAFFREKKGLTQERLSKTAGISRPYLSDLENGKCKPGGMVMLNISTALGEPVENIFFANNVNHVEHEENQLDVTQPTGTE